MLDSTQINSQPAVYFASKSQFQMSHVRLVSPCRTVKDTLNPEETMLDMDDSHRTFPATLSIVARVFHQKKFDYIMSLTRFRHLHPRHSRYSFSLHYLLPLHKPAFASTCPDLVQSTKKHHADSSQKLHHRPCLRARAGHAALRGPYNNHI